MKREEFDIIYDLAQSEDTLIILEGDSLLEVQNLRSRASVYSCRLGYELAKAKNIINSWFVELVDSGIAQRTAEIRAEHDFAQKYPVSRREIEYLRDDLKNIMNSCASKLKDKEI